MNWGLKSVALVVSVHKEPPLRMHETNNRWTGNPTVTLCNKRWCGVYQWLANVAAVRDEPFRAIFVSVSLTPPTITTKTSRSNYTHINNFLSHVHAPVLRWIFYSNERNVPNLCFNNHSGKVILSLKARLQRRFLSLQPNAIFVALKLQLQNRTCKLGAILSAICRRDIAGVSNRFETWCNFAATKIASSCRDKISGCGWREAPRIRTLVLFHSHFPFKNYYYLLFHSLFLWYIPNKVYQNNQRPKKKTKDQIFSRVDPRKQLQVFYKTFISGFLVTISFCVTCAVHPQPALIWHSR